MRLSDNEYSQICSILSEISLMDITNGTYCRLLRRGQSRQDLLDLKEAALIANVPTHPLEPLILRR